MALPEVPNDFWVDISISCQLMLSIELLATAWSRVRVERGREEREYNECQNIFVT